MQYQGLPVIAFGASSYSVYSGSQVVPQPVGATFLLQRGVQDTFFIDAQARVGVDTIPFYQVTAVNAAGESPKSNKAQLSAPAVELPVVIQGTVVQSNGKTALVKTPDHGLDCPPNTPCPAIAIVGVTYEVDLSRALYEAPDGTPVATPKLTKGQAVVVVGHKDPSLMSGTRHPLLLAQIVELVLVSPGGNADTTPPTITPVGSGITLVPNPLTSQGGKAYVVVDVTDDSGVDPSSVKIDVLQANGKSLLHGPQPMISFNSRPDRWGYQVNLPANANNAADNVYQVTVTAGDTMGNHVTPAFKVGTITVPNH